MTESKIVQLTPFRADLGRALARRAERLLAAADLSEEVAVLDPLEAYYIIREVGLAQALPVLLELSEEQLATCVDLDCWQRHDFAVDSLDEWLSAFTHAGPEALAKAFFSLGYVVRLLYLARTVTVYDPDMDQVPPQENEEENEPARAMTPDGFFLLELKTDLALRVHPFTVLDSLYQDDLAATHQLLSEVRVDLSLQIEEEALRFRNGRLEDIGFVAPDEAAILFSLPPRRPSVVRPRHPLESSAGRVPALYAAPLVESSLLQQALALIDDQEFLACLEQELVWCINSAVIAYGEKTKDTKQVSDIVERVRDTVSLGLESLLAGENFSALLDDNDAARAAARLLALWPISDLFRHGFAAGQMLGEAVRQAMAEPLFRAWNEMADSEQDDDPEDRSARAFVTALLGRHPLRGGCDLARPEEVKAFACLADIDLARLRLQRLVAEISHR